MQEIAHHDFAFEDIVSKPAQQLQILAEKLQIRPKVCLILHVTGMHIHVPMHLAIAARQQAFGVRCCVDLVQVHVL